MRERSGNLETVTSVSKTIRTIEQLLTAIGLDRACLDRMGDSEWLVENWTANKWDQGLVLNGEHSVAELWQVKASIRRRRAVPIEFAPLAPLAITLRIPKPVASKQSERLRRCLVIPDSQHGFARMGKGGLDPLHDRVAWATMVEVARYAKCNRAIFLGDMLDLPDWSDKFLHGPEFVDCTQPAMVELAWNIAQVMSVLAPYGDEQPEADYLSGNHECFDPKTEVLTKRGWARFEAVTPSDELLTLNTDTDALEFQRPIRVGAFPFKGDLQHVTTSRLDIMVTDNHRMWWRSGHSRSYRMSEFFELPLGKTTKVVQRIAGRTRASGVSFNDAEICLSAWILTDGHISLPTASQKAGRPYRVYGFTQRPERAHLITDALDAVGVEYTMSVRHRDIGEICGRALKAEAKPSCDIRVRIRSRHKLERLVTKKGRLPNWVWEMDNRQARIFIETLVDADGSRHKSAPDTSWVIYKSKEFLDDVQALCIMHGFAATLTEYRTGHWRLNLCPRTETCIDGLTQDHYEQVPYEGLVYCAQVPNGTLVVRRNGKPVITGNSRMVKAFYANLPAACALRPVNDPDGPPIYSLDRLLGLKELGVRFHPDYPDGHLWLNDNLRVSHGEKARGESGDTMKAILRDARYSELVGHLHHYEAACKTTHPRYGAVTYQAFCPGTLARIDGRVPAATSRVNWQQGFAIVDFEPGNGLFKIEHVPIHNGVAIFDGRIFRGYFDPQRLVSEASGWRWAA